MVQAAEILPYGKQGSILPFIINTSAADDLAMQGARSSAALVLI